MSSNYLTEPASKPRTKYFCNEKKTIKGTEIVTNAPAVRVSQLEPYCPTKDAIFAFIGATLSRPLEKVSATSKSFQTQRNWKMAKDAIPGIESGNTIDLKILK